METNLSQLLHRAAKFESHNGGYQAAHRHLTESYNIRKRLVGEEDRGTIFCLTEIGTNLSASGQYEKATEFQSKALQISKNVSAHEFSI